MGMGRHLTNPSVSLQESERMFTFGGRDKDFKWPRVNASQVLPSDDLGCRVVSVQSFKLVVFQYCKQESMDYVGSPPSYLYPESHQ